MTTEELKYQLLELENHFILMLSEEELDDELKELKNTVLTKISLVKHTLRRRLKKERIV